MKKYRASRFRRYRGRQIEDYRMPRRYRRRQGRRAGTRMFSLFALIFVVAGLGVIGYSLLGEDAPLSKVVSNATGIGEEAAITPTDTTLWLTVPKMSRVEDLPIYSTAWDDETALEVSAQHIDSTGYPWEDGANVYIAGHRMGYPGTKSFLVFYDLDTLEDGDEVFLTDSEGTQYTYTVFEQFVSDPYDWSITEPVTDKSIITLQTCTLPDYVQRLVVQAELTEVTPGAGVPEEDTEPEEEADPATTSQYGFESEAIPQYGFEPEAIPQYGFEPEAIPQEEFIPEAIPQQDIAPEPLPQPLPEPLPEAVPQQQIVPQQGVVPAVAYPLLAFFTFRGRRLAVRRSTGAPSLRCWSTISGTSASSRPRYQEPFGSDPS